MKIVGVIPARYASTRLPGKPLADICGKPMIWHVYEKVCRVPELDKVVCAVDDVRVADVCRKHDIDFIMTSPSHPNHIERVQEVSDKVISDLYVCINGDEPLIEPASISAVIQNSFSYQSPYVGCAVRAFSDPAGIIDFANIKVTVSENKKCIYMSRSPIPYPRGSSSFKYLKYVGIECFDKKSLDLFSQLPPTHYEQIEDIDHLRFIENGIPVKGIRIESDSLSVDTAKDLEYVRQVISGRVGGEAKQKES